MRNAVVIAVIALALIGGMIWLKSSSPDETQEISQVTVDNMRVYDVRTSEEYNAGHTKDAKLLPLDDIEAGQLPDVAKDEPIAVYCRSGSRASYAKALLEKAGFTNVRNLGGLSNLQQYGLEMVAPSSDTCC